MSSVGDLSATEIPVYRAAIAIEKIAIFHSHRFAEFIFGTSKYRSSTPTRKRPTRKRANHYTVTAV